MSILLYAALVILCGISTVNSQDECQAQTYCGGFCCPNTLNVLNTQCCVDSRACCAPNEKNSLRPVCGGRTCPDSLITEEVYDSDDNLRNQCCTYFREGCCSEEENATLNLLYALAIGLGAGVFVLLVIAVLLFLCCCCIFFVK